MSAADRRLVLVVGVGRSGTSLLTGVMGELGFHIPQPEVEADDTNPRGFSEPRWVVDFHSDLLKARRTTVNDSRPSAWESTFAAADDPEAQATLRAWLLEQTAAGDAIVVKDPRTVWFLPLWERCATELGIPTSYVTMLRHPTEILKSAVKSYGTWQTAASRASAWLNVALETEHVTRGKPRAFVRHEDLLADWRREIDRVGTLLDLPLITGGISPERAQAVDAFVDPGLHRNRIGWAELDVPARVEELAEQAWDQLQPLAAPGGDTPEAQAQLDETRATFGTLYAEAEAIAQSSITAAKAGRRRKPAAAAASGSGSASTPTLRVRIARRIPKRYRRRIRRALGRAS